MPTARGAARKFFADPWIFIRGVPSMKFLPPIGPDEVAFAGRSNVGKSSLINALTAKKGVGTYVKYAWPDTGIELLCPGWRV